MGFSTSGAMAVIFVGLLVAVGIAYPVLETAHDRRASALDDRDQRALDVRNTAVNITEIDATENRTTLENTGTTTLSVDETDLLINGEYIDRDRYDATIDDVDRSIWQPGEILEFDFELDVEDEVNLESGDRVKIVTENGIAVTGEVEE